MPEEEKIPQDGPVERLSQWAGQLSILEEDGGPSEEERESLKQQIGIFLDQFSDDERKQILWESLRRRAMRVVENTLQVLDRQEVKDLYLAGERKEPPEQYFERITSGASGVFVDIIQEVLYHDTLFTTIAPPLKGRITPVYPYNELEMADNLPLSTILVNIGHDMTHLPGFLPQVYLLPERLKKLREKGEFEQNAEEKFYYQVLPLLYHGLVFDFEAFKQFLENQFLLKEGANLAEVLRVVAAEGTVRARSYDSPIVFDQL